jgi:hypothetical protein
VTIGGGKTGFPVFPTSEPDVRISRIRLSGQRRSDVGPAVPTASATCDYEGNIFDTIGWHSRPYVDWEPYSIEGAAYAAETIEEHTHWESDWGTPGKQHQTNQVHNN